MKISQAAIDILNKGGVGVLATDTLYGIVGCALQKIPVQKIYKLRRRNPRKPCIILISSIKDLSQFSITPKSFTQNVLKKVWPGTVSVILDCPNKKFTYLHRGTKTLAFRLPKSKKLIGLLKKTGPLIAPSANIEDRPPALSIQEAEGYFKNKADFYLDAGKKEGTASTVIAITNNTLKIIRQGIAKVPKRV